MNVVGISHLFKSFGTHEVIKDMSFEVPEHSVFGFIGQNGAGKTTTMKMILGLLKPDAGKITVCDEPVTYGQNNTCKYIGYLPDVPEFYGYMRPKEYLRLCGQITGMKDFDIKKRSNELLERVGLEKSNKKIAGFSRGMKQRLGIAQALLNNPRVLICDEPTSALDPLGRKDILDILEDVKGSTTVIFSTHILSDVERICDNVAVLNNGTVCLQGSINDIKQNHRQDALLVEFPDSTSENRFNEICRGISLINKYEKNEKGIILSCKNLEETERQVMSKLVENKLMPIKLEKMEPDLESLFIEAVTEEGGAK